jgi:hypothetical protein
MEQVLCLHNQSITDYGAKQISCAGDTYDWNFHGGYRQQSFIILLAFLPAIRLPQRAREKVKNRLM